MLSASWSWFIGYAWQRLTPADVHALITEASTRTSVLGLLTFHHNGYVRHEALRLLTREVRKNLEASPASLRGEWLCRVAIEDQRRHVRETAVRLIYALGKWRCLPWPIRASVQPDRPTAQLAQGFIETWFVPPRCNRVFTTPSRQETQAIIEALDDSRREMDDTFQRKLDLWLKNP